MRKKTNTIDAMTFLPDPAICFVTKIGKDGKPAAQQVFPTGIANLNLVVGRLPKGRLMPTRTLMYTYKLPNGKKDQQKVGDGNDYDYETVLAEMKALDNYIKEKGYAPKHAPCDYSKDGPKTVHDFVMLRIEDLKTTHRNWLRMEQGYKTRVLPYIGHLMFGAFTADHAANIVTPIWEKEGHYGTAYFIHALLSGLVSWAKKKRHPVYGLLWKGPNVMDDVEAPPAAPEGAEGTRDGRSLSLAEIKALWHNLPNLTQQPWAPFVVKLQLLTGCRINEVCGIRKSELRNWGKENPYWIIPKERVKHTNKKTVARDFVMPLSPQAVEVIQKLLDLLEKRNPKGDVLMPGKHTGSPIQAGQIRHVIHGLHENGAFAAIGITTVFRSHDLRRTVASLPMMKRYYSAMPMAHLHSMLMLNHSDGSVHARYQRGHLSAAEAGQTSRETKLMEFFEEKQIGFIQWGAFIENVVNGSDDNVVAFPKRVA